MKWVLYIVLFCIGFLNVPRSIVHDCASDSHQDHASIHSDEHDSSGLQIEQDDCHICEFQLDFFEVPSLHFAAARKSKYFIPVPSRTEDSSADLFRIYDLRGPPAFDLLG